MSATTVANTIATIATETSRALLTKLMKKMRKSIFAGLAEIVPEEYTKEDFAVLFEESFEEIFTEEAFNDTIHSSVKEEVEKSLPKPSEEEKPKKAPNAYILWAKENRQRIGEETGIKGTELTKEVARQWNLHKTGASTSSAEKPKGAANAYIIFGRENRQKIGEKTGLKGKDLTSEVARVWKALSEKEQKPYKVKADADKERAKEEVEKFVEEGGVIEKKERKPRAKSASSEDKPKKAPNAYIIWCKENRQRIGEETGLKGLALSGAVADAWNALKAAKKAEEELVEEVVEEVLEEKVEEVEEVEEVKPKKAKRVQVEAEGESDDEKPLSIRKSKK